jgi:hypothetical protein
VGGAVFFPELRNCRFTQNGLDGFEVRFGANCWNFNNCQFDKNGRKGLHQYTDGGATYGTVINGGQASYNKEQGWYFESGTDVSATGIYAEYNCSPDNTNTNGYTNTALSTTDRKVDTYVGDNVSRSDFNLAAVLNNDATHVRAPQANRTTVVRSGDTRYNPMCDAVAVSTATTVAQLTADFNAAMAKLRAQKVI